MTELWDPTVNPSGLGICIQTHSYQELITEKEARKNPMGFCVNKSCNPWKSIHQKRSSTAYRLSTHKSFISGYVTKNHSEATCPHCEYALFWSRHYFEAGHVGDIEEQNKARLLVDDDMI